jgi:hypothetical protein
MLKGFFSSHVSKLVDSHFKGHNMLVLVVTLDQIEVLLEDRVSLCMSFLVCVGLTMLRKEFDVLFHYIRVRFGLKHRHALDSVLREVHA